MPEALDDFTMKPVCPRRTKDGLGAGLSGRRESQEVIASCQEIPELKGKKARCDIDIAAMHEMSRMASG